MMISIMKQKIKKLLSLIFWILIWEFIYLIVDKEIFIVSPYTSFKRILILAQTFIFWNIILNSIIRIFIGFIIAICSGIILAILAKRFSIIYNLFYPLFNIIRAAPVASFIILTLVMMKSDIVPIFISFIMVIPISYINIISGLNNINIRLIQMSKIFKFSNIKIIKYIYIPSIFPNFIAAVKSGIGLAWKSGIAAEILCSPKYSIGGEIYNAKVYLKTEDVFAWTIVVIILSIVIEKIFISGVEYVYRKNIKKI